MKKGPIKLPVQRELEMADDIIPLIAETDYEDFLIIIERYFPDSFDEWPPTYPEWCKVHREDINQRYRKGHEVREVAVTPDEFREYCRGRNCTDIPQDLWRCAKEKDARMQAPAGS